MGDVITGIDGLGKIERKIKRYENPEKYFDDVIYDAVNGARDEFQLATPNPKKNNHRVFNTSTGYTRRSWQRVKKIDDSVYQIENTASSKDKKHAIVDIIRHGRGPVKPKKAPLLFIPMNKKTADKARNNVYDNIVYGKDYTLSKGVGPMPANDFVTPVNEKLQKQMVKNVLNKVNKDFK